MYERLAWVLLSAGPGTPNGSELQDKGVTNYPGKGHFLPEGNIIFWSPGDNGDDALQTWQCERFQHAPELKARGNDCGHIFLDKMWVPTLRTSSSTTIINSILEEFSHQLLPQMSLHQAKAISHVTGWHQGLWQERARREVICIWQQFGTCISTAFSVPFILCLWVTGEKIIWICTMPPHHLAHASFL